MMTDTEKWIAALRECKGKKFHHQGRSTYGKGGLDCVGLLIAASEACEFGIDASAIQGYAKHPDVSDFENWCNIFLVQKPFLHAKPVVPQMEVGDILTFWANKSTQPRHLAVYTGVVDGTAHIIHAESRISMSVVEEPLFGSIWSRRIHKLWRLPTEGDE